MISQTSAETLTVPFYGVYLLCSQSAIKRLQGKCYVGFTKNPNRRIEQHNRGMDFGGAKRTNNKGPWKMLMIIYGFPNNISALQFEWAWQQPGHSSRLKNYSDLSRKRPKESHFDYHFRILSRMLQVEPWKRLPLKIHWLETEYEQEFDAAMKPAIYMEIKRGKVLMPKRLKETDIPALYGNECHLCLKSIENIERQRMVCVNKLCKLTVHIICMANYLISTSVGDRGHYIPIAGECPLCEQTFTWIELLQHKRKLQGISCESENDDESDDMELEQLHETADYESHDED